MTHVIISTLQCASKEVMLTIVSITEVCQKLTFALVNITLLLQAWCQFFQVLPNRQ